MQNITETEYTDYYEPSIDKVIGESDSIICRPFPSLEVICKRREDSFRAKYYKIKKNFKIKKPEPIYFNEYKLNLKCSIENNMGKNCF